MVSVKHGLWTADCRLGVNCRLRVKCRLQTTDLLRYYQTFFDTWRNEHSWYENLKNAIKNWGHCARLCASRLLKWGIFTGCAFNKRLNHLHTELSHGYLKDTKFYLESKASFIGINSIASFKLFWLLGCRNIALFWTVPWLTWIPRLGQNTPSRELYSKINRALLSNFFFLFNYVLH